MHARTLLLALSLVCATTAVTPAHAAFYNFTSFQIDSVQFTPLGAPPIGTAAPGKYFNARFDVRGSFTLAAESNGIDLTTEPIQFGLGDSNFVVEPDAPGTLHDTSGGFLYAGRTLNHVRRVLIRPGTAGYRFRLTATRMHIPEPGTLTLRINDDIGQVDLTTKQLITAPLSYIHGAVAAGRPYAGAAGAAVRIACTDGMCTGQTDPHGQFLLGALPGSRNLIVDGKTLGNFGRIARRFDVMPGVTDIGVVVLPVLASDGIPVAGGVQTSPVFVAYPSGTAQPNVSMTIPAGADVEFPGGGTGQRRISITRVPLDSLPLPFPAEAAGGAVYAVEPARTTVDTCANLLIDNPDPSRVPGDTVAVWGIDNAAGAWVQVASGKVTGSGAKIAVQGGFCKFTTFFVPCTQDSTTVEGRLSFRGKPIAAVPVSLQGHASMSEPSSPDQPNFRFTSVNTGCAGIPNQLTAYAALPLQDGFGYLMGASQTVSAVVGEVTDIGSIDMTVCGNGVAEGVENCDGSDLRGATCESRGYDRGSLLCSATCSYDEGACVVCGDRRIGDGETCDPPWNSETNEGRGCDQNCELRTCGDGVIDLFAGEQCDDGNRNNFDGCSSTCRYEICGDGVAQPGEGCDGGDLRGATCKSLGFSGGVLSCSACKLNTSLCGTCGNGVVEQGESCDPPWSSATGANLGCSASCSLAVCGDGVVAVTAGEQCDDGNARSNDGCSATCKIEKCGDGVVQKSEECDPPADSLCKGLCRNDCSCPPVCGDGLRNSSTERCDGTDDALCPGACDAQCECPAQPITTTTLPPADCPIGFDVMPVERARSQSGASNFELGFMGIGHDRDVAGGSPIRLDVDCAGNTPPCGTCQILGLSAVHGRCANDPAIACDQINAVDTIHCGAGNRCDVPIFPPLHNVWGGAPGCFVDRLVKQPSGFVQNETGRATLTVALHSDMYWGISASLPCPICTGDPTSNDGVKGGTCIGGPADKRPCDANGDDPSFGDTSFDCLPDPKLLGNTIPIEHTLKLTTDKVSLAFGVPCDPTVGGFCPCATCAGNPAVACSSNADCVAAGTIGPCDSNGDGVVRKANDCDDHVCTDSGDGIHGVCAAGPIEHYCDGSLFAHGDPYLVCLSNADCDELADACGGDCGECTIEQPRSCFLNPIVNGGKTGTTRMVLGDVHCQQPGPTSLLSAVAGLPGPERVRLEVQVKRRFASAP